jgi:hypothetical protein
MHSKYRANEAFDFSKISSLISLLKEEEKQLVVHEKQLSSQSQQLKRMRLGLIAEVRWRHRHHASVQSSHAKY